MKWPIALVAIAACGGARVAPETRAYIVSPTPESRQAVAHAVALALAIGFIALDEDAFTRDSSLEIVRSQAHDPRPAIAGRDQGAPGVSERFHLVKIGEHCVLVHDRTDRHYDLMGTSCAPM
jgi:hypothetical protein